MVGRRKRQPDGARDTPSIRRPNSSSAAPCRTSFLSRPQHSMNLETSDMSQQTTTRPRDPLVAPPAAAERKLHRVFVTGGSGFVGQHLLGALKREGIECVALARSLDAAR